MKTVATRQRARRWARALRHLPDRLLHGLRRRRAFRRYGGRAPGSVLFVCYGNICRSPYAAAAYARLLDGDGVQVASAGFIGPERASPPEGQTVALRRGIDLSTHRSQLLSERLLRAFELVVVMERSQAAALARDFGRRTNVLVLGDLDPHAIDTRTILDPYSRTEEVFEQVYDRIDRCLMSFAATREPM